MPDRPQRPALKHYAALFCMAFSVILWEILLTRIYSVMLFYHFAFMAVSVAMFGLTMGALLATFMRPLPDAAQQDRRLGWFALSTSLLMVFGIVLQLSWPPPTSGPWALPLLLIRTYVFSALPFVPAGALIGIQLTQYQQVNRLYAADLLGAGLACLLIPLLLTRWGGPGAVFAGAAMACLAAVFCFGAVFPRWRQLSLLGVLMLLTVGLFNTRFDWLRVKWRHGEQLERPLHEKWNAFSRIMVRPGPAQAFGWGIDEALRARFSKAPQLLLEIDSGAGTPITAFDGDLKRLEYLRYDITSFAHHLRQPARVLVIGPGGGRDLLTALAFRQPSVVGVEVNPAIVDAVNGIFGEFSGHLDRHPGVRWVVDEARSYLEGTSETFDIIQASLVDTVAATAAGAYSFVENGLYTIEAWRSFLSRLSPNGVLSFSRWYFGSTTWPVEVSRLVALGVETLRAEGIADPAGHLLLIRNRNLHPRKEGIATLMVSRSPFSGSDIERAGQVCKDLRCEIALASGKGDSLLEEIATASFPKELYAGLPLDISPPTDNKPYFFFHARLKDVWNRQEREGFGGSAFNLPAMRILLTLLLLVAGLSAMLMLGPGWVVFRQDSSLRKDAAARWGWPTYFSLIGLAFMLVEIGWMQRFSLFLGHPTYGFTVILFGVLLFCAIGSGAVSWLRVQTRLRTSLWLSLLIPLLIVTNEGSELLRSFSDATLGVRVLCSLLCLGIPAVWMGAYFPLGMAEAQKLGRPYAGWCWAINGAWSVLGSVVAMLYCLVLGIQATIWVGTFIYLMAVAIFTSSRKETDGLKGTTRATSILG